jgi:TonB family protein
MEILGMSGPEAQGQRLPEQRDRLSQLARLELDRSQNIFVLAGAGTALPNLFPRTGQARIPNGDRDVFEFASALMARARSLGPSEAELSGPMPLIREFQAFQQPEVPQPQSSTVSPVPGTPTPAGMPNQGSTIRVAGGVQAAKLVEKPEVVYPPEAREARIQGVVRMNVLIRADGGVEDATLISGHPLLVTAAIDVVRRYRYQPTLLNGAPVAVISQVDVLFTFAK